ncbi:TonB-dependent receptor [Flavobacterium sp. UMI-01]|uniref:SusC/RagA family TonB-linked outer membrane protein n=1 Tax=Flavobacterium sp. UMI-01 TaxID=1441053 RepID=UPI00207DFAA5|nr:TonB-dependent receptor [Flavobacterium sp. UMI-01]GIZ09616.1 SusC/RagA family TonB-linked outer membrane protein [Flavobacterium sp. UMI-01]
MTLLLFFGYGLIHAQNNVVKGKVLDNQGALPGVSVLVKGTTTGTITDFDGNYTIKAKPTDVLVFSYLGYENMETKIANRNTINIILKSKVSSLDEVVIVGYGVQKKKEVTGAVSRVKEEDVAKSATADLGSALQGLIAGVNVTASSGDPGAEANVQIRGLSSVLGNNRPLYVVDGIPYDNNPNISMNEIETIDVLKDGASAAIYGTRGSAGVILITTKKPQAGVMKIRMDSYYGVQKNFRHIPVPTVEEKLYIQFLNKYNQSGTVFGNSWTTIQANPTQLTNNSNFYDVIENDLAPIQSHNLSISGGKDGLSYNINGGFFGQEGSLIKSNYERYNVRANTQYNKGKWKIATGMSARNEYTQYSPWGLILDAIRYNPYGVQVTADQTSIEDTGGDNSEATRLSYLGYKLQTSDKAFRDYFDGNISAEYSFTKNFKYTARGAVSYDNSTRYTINPSFIAYDNKGDLVPSQQSKVRNSSSRATKRTLEHILNYNKTFGKHNLGLTAVYSAERYQYSEFFAEKFDIVDNDITVLNGANGLANAGSGNNQWTQNRVTKFIGTLGRLQYNYKGKYLMSLSARRDGSSKFNEQHYEWFPSASLGWNVSDEDFWKPFKSTVSTFKTRMSRGTTGNSGVGDYSYSAGIVLNNDYVLGSGATDQNYIQGATQTSFANKNVKWETSVSTNLGFDFGFFNNKLTLTSDFYVTEKRDMLFPVLLPPSAGGGSGSDVVLNVGDMRNTGIEYSLNYRTGKKFKHNLNVNFTKNTNTVTKMSGTNKLLYFDDSTVSGHSNDQDKVSALAEGYIAGAYFLMKTDGVIQNEAELLEYQKIDPTAKLGDLRYVDADGDGKITNDDRRFAGSGTPDFELGLNYSAEYKNFDFSMQWYGSFGAEVINGGKALGYKESNNKDLIYQWSPQNQTSNVPADRGALHNNYRGWSDYWLEDGTFVRLRNISLGYTVPKKVIDKLTLSKLRFFVTAQNPLRLTNYTGYDPEVGNNGLSTRGIDKGTVPQSSKITAGMQLEF